MPVLRDIPYAAFNFHVSLDGLDPGSAQAGFMHVSGLDRSLELLAYRAGNDHSSAPRFVPGLAKPVTVTLSRGLIGDTVLHEWVSAVMAGAHERRNVTIQLLAEDRSPVQQWRLRGALPIELRGPKLDSMLNQLAVEQLVIVAESLTIE